MMKIYASMHFGEISHQKIVISTIYLLRMEEKSRKGKNNKNETLVINNMYSRLSITRTAGDQRKLFELLVF